MGPLGGCLYLSQLCIVVRQLGLARRRLYRVALLWCLCDDFALGCSDGSDDSVGHRSGYYQDRVSKNCAGEIGSELHNVH